MNGASELSPTVAEALALLLDFLSRQGEAEAALAAEMPPAPAPSPWLSADSAAAYLDWPRQRLYKLTARGDIPHYKQEGRLLFRRDELDAWLSHYAEGSRE